MRTRAISLSSARADGLEPAFLTLARMHPDVFWLDAGPAARSGWSFLGVGARVTDDSGIADQPIGRTDAARTGGAESGEAESGGAESGEAAVDPEWPAGPFRGGWVGWSGYDAAAARAGAPAAAEGGALPTSAWIHAERWIAVDHTTGAAWAVSAGDMDAAAWADEAEALTRAEALLRTDAGAPAPPASSAPPASGAHLAEERHTSTDYAELIERCRAAIRAGDAYQLCLTTRFTVPGVFDAVEVYRRLRATSRTGRGCFVRTRAESGSELALCSATPEQFLRVEDGVIRTRPIKGTRPRGADADSDALLARELAASEKERAENVMIVDLMRNDLALVCEPGTVRVDELLAVESYPHVHQLVSTVSGTLRPGLTVGELLRSTFPAGSMTGAPKLSAMTILHELEAGPRGVFAGCVGWIGDAGDLDLAMVIRTVVVSADTAYVGAGGGITWSSIAAEEVREVGIKATAPLAALGARLPAGW